MSDRRKREIRELMAKTGMNYTRAARELERRRQPTAQHVVGFDEVDPASRWVAEVQRAADERAKQMAAIGGSRVLAQMAEIQRAADERAKQMAAIGGSRVLAQMAEIQRAADERAKQMAAIGEPSRILAQMAEIQRAADERAKQMAAIGSSRILAQMAEIQRAVNRAKAFRVRFTPPV